MGRYSYSHRTKVESSASLSATDIAFSQEQNPGCRLAFNITWHSWDGDVPFAFVGKPETHGDTLTLPLSVLRASEGTWHKVAVRTLELESVPCRFGGVRWWHVCPYCRKRRSALFFNPQGRYFACRVCLDLRYSSQSESYRWDRGMFGMAGLRYVMLRDHREELMAERRSTHRRARKARYESRRITAHNGVSC